MTESGGPSASDLYEDAKYTAEISTRMQVPERIRVAEGESPSHGHNKKATTTTPNKARFNDLGMRQRDPRIDMQVPDRILVAGGNAHIASKSTPRELQLENAVLPPTADHVRVSTPPRSIRLDEHSFPTATDDEAESNRSSSTPTMDIRSPLGGAASRRLSSEYSAGDVVIPNRDSAAGSSAINESGMAGVASGRENLTPYEEIQLIRRQMAKLNHRLMAVELENHQQAQREMIMSLLLGAYFVGKLVLWINRSL